MFIFFFFSFLLWQETEVNLIITDYSMPGMTGYDLLRKIKVSSFAQLLHFRSYSFIPIYSEQLMKI